MAEEGTPRRGAEPDAIRKLANKLSRVEHAVAALARGANLRNASISGGDGLVVLDEAGATRLRIDPEGAIIAYATDGTETARYGLLEHSDVGEYGLEVLADGAWVHIGNESVSWNNVAGKPTSFNPTSHTHPGSQVTSQVADAANAVNAGHASEADGSQYGWANNVAGSEFYALWVGNDGGFHFGRNTSSIKYKTNVRDAATENPRRVLALRPVRYDRKPTLEVLPAGFEGPQREFPGKLDEFGLIAEETLPHVPEVVTYFEGEIDGIRYDLLPVAMIPCLQVHDEEIKELQTIVEQQQQTIDLLISEVRKLGGSV